MGADWAAAVSASVAAVGLIFGAWQVYLLNRQARYDRRVAEKGVAVSWRPEQAPARADADGTAIWRYTITARNPGRLPIDDVSVEWRFATDVQRLRYDGTVHDPTRMLLLTTPVLAGGEARVWHRHIRLPYSERHELRHTYAEIAFTNIDDRRLTNRWPRVSQSEGSRSPLRYAAASDHD
jgi:hypothetical protein